MYKRKDFPKKGDLVIGIVREISDVMVKVELEEYKGYGIIPIDELSHRRIRNIREILDLGQKVVCLVLDSDPANKLATLSLKRVSEGQKKLKLYQYKREQSAYKILEILASKKGIPMEKIEEEIIDKIIESGKYLYQVWEETYLEGKDILRKYDIPEEYLDELYKIILENFKVPKYIRKGYIEMYSLAPDGVDRIKRVLLELEKLGINIKYAGAPKYFFKIEHTNPKELDRIYKEMENTLEKMAEELEIEYELTEE